MKIRKSELKSIIKEVLQEEELWGLFRDGGSVGQMSMDNTDSGSKEEMQAKAKRMNKTLTPGEKKYYRIKYKAKRIHK
jgi:hypothetical protein